MMTSAATRTSRSTAVLLMALAAAAGVAACKNDFANSTCDNARGQINRPTDGKMIAFGLAPQSIYYHYREIQPTDTLIVDWDTTQLYFGLACLRFRTTDSVHIDPSGPFQFVTSGSNAGSVNVLHAGQTVQDTAYAVWGCAGDGGTYRLNADSTISFTWSNGQQFQYFGPQGLHRLLSDSVLHTTSEESYRADSTHASWRMNWVRTYCGEGF